MKQQLQFKTPAKINIGLNIISKREDGFHNIETIFYPIKLYDELILTESSQFELVTNNKLLNNEPGNTIVKAKELLEELTGKVFNVKIQLKKNIPIGAGMGGGSSDGAAALLSLNNFFSLGLSFNEMEDIALKIGSDVPFFIDPQVKFAMSRGEIFKNIKSSVDFSILIINPGIHISTGWAFSKIKPKRPSKSLELFSELNNSIISDNKENFVNDFEPIVLTEYPVISEIKKTLYDNGAVLAMMTGTGSTVFGFFDNYKDALKAETIYKDKFFTFSQ